MEFFVYVLELLPSKIFYIGSSCEIEKRFKRHINELDKGTHHNSNLQNAWKNTSNINFSTIECPDRISAFQMEEIMIQRARVSNRSPLLANIGNNAVGGDNFSYHPNSKELIESRSKDLKTWMGNLSSDDKKRIFSRHGEKNPMFGKTHSDETKKKLSEMHKGHSYNKGIKLSSEHIKKISERQKLRTGSKNSFFGKKHSEEARESMRKAAIGRIPNNRKAISANGIIFNSQSEAAKYFKIGVPLVSYRVKSKKFPNWFILETNPN